MKLRLLEWIRCPRCRSRLDLSDAVVESVSRPLGETIAACSGLCGRRNETSPTCEACDRLEVERGILTCGECRTVHHVRDGVPRFAGAALQDHVKLKAETSERFGHLWAQAPAEADQIPATYHYETMSRAVPTPRLAGLVLDAGCGEGVDLVNQARLPGVQVIGAELSDGGCRTTARRIRREPDAHVVQADLEQVPFADRTFDHIYSYGVLHHMASPSGGLKELVRTARPGGSLLIYLYEDFSDRSLAWRCSLATANSLRHITTRMPPRLLYAMCRIASPFVYVLFTVPHHTLKHAPVIGRLALRIPFRHGKGPFRLTGDLFDRFSAPVEFRYSRSGAIAFLRDAGARVLEVGNDRGWVLLGQVPE